MVICCLKISNCETGIILWLNIGLEGAPAYTTWSAEVGNNFTTTDPQLPGNWLIENVCCSGTCPDYTANCQVTAITTDVTLASFGAVGCPVFSVLLTNCQDGSTLYVSGIDVAYIDSVITIAEYPGCWIVSGVATAADEAVTLLNAYDPTDGCTCCLGEPYPPKPTSVPALPYSETTPLSPRLFYQVTQGACDIKANVKFANGYYKLFQSLKNGYGNCCDTIDLDKLWIKKEQSDYSVMTDPNACITPTEVTPVICEEPS